MRSVVLGVALSHALLVVVVGAAVLQGSAGGGGTSTGTAALPLLAGCALAWLWGLQHGLAADHVAAIDDVTRMRVGAGAASTGTHFAIGHGLAVCAGVLAVSGTWSVITAVELPARVLVTVVLAGLCIWNVRLLLRARGAAASGGFASGGGASGAGGVEDGPPRSLLLGLILALRGRRGRRGRRRRRGGDQAVPAGVVSAWWQVVGLGGLFGLVSIGEVLVMALAVGPREGGALALLAVAVSFSAGMVLTDSGDSVLLGRMYVWSCTDPARGASLARRATLLTAVVSGVVAMTIAVGVLAQIGLVRSGPLLLLAGLGERYVLVGATVVGVFAVLWGSTWLWSRWHGSDPGGPAEGSRPSWDTTRTAVPWPT